MLTRFCCPRNFGIASFLWEFLSPKSTIIYCVELLISYFLLKGMRDFWFEDLMSERRKIQAACPRARQGSENCGFPIAPKICCRPIPQETNFSKYPPSIASSAMNKTPLQTSIYSAAAPGSTRGPLSMAHSQGQYPPTNTFANNPEHTVNYGASLGPYQSL